MFIAWTVNTPLIILFIQWEPGFNGGFTQHFETKIREVTTGHVTTGKTTNWDPARDWHWSDCFAEKSPATDLDSNAQFLYQNITVDPNTKYSFSVRAINVQGGSQFSQEKIKELKGLLFIYSIKKIYLEIFQF